jgi:uncharacterized protein YfaS (alpha-2-macroglobulin family)
MSKRWFLVTSVAVTLLCWIGSYTGLAIATSDPWRDVQKVQNEGNYKEALEQYRKLVLDAQAPPGKIALHLPRVMDCLRSLNQLNQFDSLTEEIVTIHSDQWQVLKAVANLYFSVEHYGYLISGEFQRGDHRGGGKVINAMQRDRIRGLQLMRQAMPLVIKNAHSSEAAGFFLEFATIWQQRRGHQESWQLQFLSDLESLPDYQPGYGYYGGSQGAPVDQEGNPIYYHKPVSFADAENDGQRWRWCLTRAAELNAFYSGMAQMRFADFLHQQFGVQTMASYGLFFGRMDGDYTSEVAKTFELHTLSENETLARLATGVRRFELPDEFNFIRIYRQLAQTNPGNLGENARDKLARLFENRRQYPEAASLWKGLLQDHGITDLSIDPESIENNSSQVKWLQHYKQIVGNWGIFEPSPTQAAGSEPTVQFRFRNGRQLSLSAQPIYIDKLLSDLQVYLKSNPNRDNDFYQKINIDNLGWRLVHENQKQYLSGKPVNWQIALTPQAAHFDKRITISCPVKKSGAYLLTAKMADGNTSKMILWLADTVIVEKPLDGQSLTYIADALDGRPVAGAEIEYFGYRRQYNKWKNKDDIKTRSFKRQADGNGMVQLDADQRSREYQWLVIARTKDGRLAYQGFTGNWIGRWYEKQYRATKTFFISDRPVYRPNQKVDYKFWVRQARYDQGDSSLFAGENFTIELHSPRGEKVLEKNFIADEFGGIVSSWEIPEDASLGVYLFQVKQGSSIIGTGSFRVEEYKKPEFEVIIEAPMEPVMLGEEIEATIRAKYYFGAPVVNGRVKYKITRTPHDDRWYPAMPWDWLFGPGYWWFSYDYNWYPGWQRWGCLRPTPLWWPGRSLQPPELVAELETEIGDDGTVKVNIDTTLAAAIHGDTDHNYTITAEVRDESRRTIVGSGRVLVARKPFSVNVWVDRGYYRVGDTILANFKAQTLDHQPIQGKGRLALMKVAVDKDGRVVEREIRHWDLDTDAQGGSRLQIAASKAGQYRLAYKVTDSKGHQIEGGYVLTIRGVGSFGEDFRFNAIEVIPEKAEYAPGEKVRLQLNTEQSDSHVLLFLRAANGNYQTPELLHLEGKSVVEEFEISDKDMPNIFVEAVTVSGGKVHSEIREIVVPPEKRLVNIDIEPGKKEYRPGEKARVQLKLSDLNGEPLVGQLVVSIYDKSVEYISGGSNVADIKEFFWKWRRQHYPSGQNSLGRYGYTIAAVNGLIMQNLGVFGGTVADDLGSTREGQTGDASLPVPMSRALSLNKQAVLDSSIMEESAGEESAGRGVDGAMSVGGNVPGSADFSDKVGPLESEQLEASSEPEKFLEATVRKEFADTALWRGTLMTDEQGIAEVELEMPENLTTWKINVWSMSHGTKVAEGHTEVITRKDLLIRLQAPRFFVEKDEVVLSANVHNYLQTDKRVKVALELQGGPLKLLPGMQAEQLVDIKAQGEKRIDWRVLVVKEGQAGITVKAMTDEESDGMMMEFPSYIHGMLKLEARSGVIRPEKGSGSFSFTVPRQRKAEQSELVVRYSPTLAGAMIDALPYLVNYPYGCTEQTLNRFLPTVITQKALIDMGVDLQEISTKRTNLNAQELGEAGERAAQWQRYDRNPVFEPEEVTRMAREGLERLVSMQNADGGWGWFSGIGERSYPHTTATVVHGLHIANSMGVAFDMRVLDRGLGWLLRYQDQQIKLLENALRKNRSKLSYKNHADNLDALVFMVLAEAGKSSDSMGDFLYRDRTKLSVYGMALFGTALDTLGENTKRDMLVGNISQYVEQDDENQTAWLNLAGAKNSWWYWYGSEWESHAYFLKLLTRTEPKGELASRLVKYLLNNRKHGSYWNSTRDTAICVEAFAEYLHQSGEDKPDMTVEILYDGKIKKSVRITPETLFSFDDRWVLDGESIETGNHRVEIRRQGRGPVYYNGYLQTFTLEDFIDRAGLEVKVNRKYYRLVELGGSARVPGSRAQVVDQKVEKFKRIELAHLSELQSGDKVEVELSIDSKNDYEYLIFEDFKPAGFEPLEVRSGYNGNEMGAYVEFRDNRVVFFVRRLARGSHSLSYRMRAEIPGTFSALPTRAWAMYAPELKGNSDEIRLKVVD